MSEAKDTAETSTTLPWQRIDEQIRALDRALSTIDGFSDESDQARSYIVGQIEALRWASKLWTES